jgi:peptidoglycan/xylan/chitin deacetylase (PgdA/CDA1 family)
MLAVSCKTFEKHMEYISKNHTPISLAELNKKLKDNTLTGKEMCVTFDDGYKDNYINALPILEKYKVPATIFVTTSNIGLVASFEWDKKYNEKCRAIFLSEDEIKILSRNPLIEIGAHTHNHKRLSDLKNEDQKYEIETSKNILEKIIERKVSLFAYPFGSKRDFNMHTIKIIKNAGFLSAYENTGLLVTNRSNTLSLPRINIRENTVEKFKKLL